MPPNARAAPMRSEFWLAMKSATPSETALRPPMVTGIMYLLLAIGFQGPLRKDHLSTMYSIWHHSTLITSNVVIQIRSLYQCYYLATVFENIKRYSKDFLK